VQQADCNEAILTGLEGWDLNEVIILPEGLRLVEVDPVLVLVCGTLGRIKLELHEAQYSAETE
jgi:hypothetical protein